jgi:Uma2 family endonuclease
VEVADSSLVFDKSVKIPRYAMTGVQEVWLIDLGNGVATVYREPFEGRYLSETPVGAGGVLSPMAFPDVAVPMHLVVRS